MCAIECPSVLGRIRGQIFNFLRSALNLYNGKVCRTLQGMGQPHFHGLSFSRGVKKRDPGDRAGQWSIVYVIPCRGEVYRPVRCYLAEKQRGCDNRASKS